MPRKITTAAEAAQSPVSLLHVSKSLDSGLVYAVYAGGKATGATVVISTDPDKPSSVYVRERIDGQDSLTRYPFRSLAAMRRYLNERFAS